MASADLEGIGGLLVKFGGILMLRLGGGGEPRLLGQSLLGLDDEALSLGLLLSRYCRHVGLVGTGALWYRAVAMRVESNSQVKSDRHGWHGWRSSDDR